VKVSAMNVAIRVCFDTAFTRGGLTPTEPAPGRPPVGPTDAPCLGGPLPPARGGPAVVISES
jgi:hypothetical protein